MREKKVKKMEKEENKEEKENKMEKEEQSEKKIEENEGEKKAVKKDEKISLKISARNELFEIKIKKESKTSSLASDIDELVEEIQKSKNFNVERIVEKPTQKPQSTSGVPVAEDEVTMIETGLDVSSGRVRDILGIRNENIQILRPGKLEASENGLLILAANEFGLRRQGLPYDEWKELCEANNIKSKTTFSKIALNHKNYGNIDKKKYMNSKELVLTPKGINTLKKALES